MTTSEEIPKYTLVPAEEVKPAKELGKKPTSPKNRKGKTQWAHVSMTQESGVVSGDDGHASTNSKEDTGSASSCADLNNRMMGDRRRGRGRGRGGRWRGNGGRRFNGGPFRSNYKKPDLVTTATYAVQQMEFYFTPDNLCRDPYLRSMMDEEGYVPVALVANFFAVCSMHQDLPTLLDALDKSETLDLDRENEKIRLKKDWKKWLFPNANGGLGLPLYVKVKEEELEIAGEKDDSQAKVEGLENLDFPATSAAPVPKPVAEMQGEKIAPAQAELSVGPGATKSESEIEEFVEEPEGEKETESDASSTSSSSSEVSLPGKLSYANACKSTKMVKPELKEPAVPKKAAKDTKKKDSKKSKVRESGRDYKQGGKVAPKRAMPKDSAAEKPEEIEVMEELELELVNKAGSYAAICRGIKKAPCAISGELDRMQQGLDKMATA